MSHRIKKSISSYAFKVLAGTAIAINVAMSSASAQEGPPENFILPGFITDIFSNASDHCIHQGQHEKSTEHTLRLQEMTNNAKANSQMGTYLLDTAHNSLGYTMCLIDDPIQIGTNRLKFLQDFQGPYHVFYGTISFNNAAFPDNLTDDEILDLQTFGLLEESAHALNSAGLLINSQIDANNFAALLSVKEVIQKMWADEAIASSTAIVAAKQQAENGNTRLWDTLSKFEIYHNVITAIDQVAQEDTNSLYNGQAQLRGFQAWYNTPELTGRAVLKVIPLYEQQFKAFQSVNAPVDIQNFGPQNILEMAASVNAYDAFSARADILLTVTSPLLFEGLNDDIKSKISAVESKVAQYKSLSENSSVPNLKP
jgi:hypothetical protein